MADGAAISHTATYDYDFFISRTENDRAWAEWIAWQLEQLEIAPGRHLRVLLQDWDFVPGANWPAEMDNAIRRSHRIIPVLSANYLKESPFGKAEWLAFWQRDPEGLRRRVIPVRIEPCPVDGLLASVVYVDLANLTEEQAIARLTQSIAATVGNGNRPPHAPAFPPVAGNKALTGARPTPKPPWMTFAHAHVHWPHGLAPSDSFIGRRAQLDRLSRWAADPDITVVGITAIGGAGKTSLVNEWLARPRPAHDRFQGVFGWSFYEQGPEEQWDVELLNWLEKEFGLVASSSLSTPKKIVESLVSAPPLILFLDGLEVLQSTPKGTRYGTFLDGALREVLTALSQIDNACFIVLTSRFPFADLETFGGTTARLLEVARLEPEEGAQLLNNTGGGWLSHPERVRLVQSVDGHALAVSVLAATLRTNPTGAELSTLRRALSSPGSTSERVVRLFRFYSTAMNPEDRTLVAIVSLFQRPVPTDVIRTVAAGLGGNGAVAEWTTYDIRDAVHQRLPGLLTWHTGNAVSSHPLIRDHFRPLILSPDVAKNVSSIALADLPNGAVTTVPEAERVVELIELLLSAGDWEEADQLYTTRTAEGWIFLRLPAVRLGLRAAMAFTETGGLSSSRSDFYLNEAGLFAGKAGDLDTAERLLRESAETYASRRDTTSQGVVLRNLTRCLMATGRGREAWSTAASAVTAARGDVAELIDAEVCLAAVCDMLGETADANRLYLRATGHQIELDSHGDAFLYSGNGALWSDFLLRTGRRAAAAELAGKNRAMAVCEGWHADVARCDTVLGHYHLATGDMGRAGTLLESACRVFRAGEMLPELADALPYLAEQRRSAGDLHEAIRLCTEAVAIASSRNLIRANVQAIATRARARLDLFLTDHREVDLQKAEDDAEQALRLATRNHRLPWSELAALETKCHLAAVLDDRTLETSRRALEDLRDTLWGSRTLGWDAELR